MISSLAECADEVLIPMAIAGRNDCFSVLMDRHLIAVKKRLRLMVSNEADLEDLVQETQFKAWRHLSAFRSESNLRTWMIRIAINEACQLYRRGKGKRLAEPLGEAIPWVEDSPDQLLARAEATEALRSAVAKLPPKYEEVLTLRDLCELSGEEAARRLHTTISTIKTRLFRARVKLSAELRNSGKFSPARPSHGQVSRTKDRRTNARAA